MDGRQHLDDATGGDAAYQDRRLRGADDLGGLAHLVATAPIAESDAGRIDQIRALENLKAACAATQARVTARFAADRRRAATPESSADTTPASNANAAPLSGTGTAPAASTDATPPSNTNAGSARRARAAMRRKAERLARRSAAGEIALARRESPQRGGRFVGFSDALVHEMPHTLAALQSGTINEWRATLIVRGTACLSREQRTAADAEIAAHPERLDGLGDQRLEARVKKIAYGMAPTAVTSQAEKAAADRRVTLRPAPDCMGYLTQLLPIATATACFAALQHSADTQPAADDQRTRAQRIADEAVTRLMTTPAPAAAVTTSAPAAPTDADSTGDDSTGDRATGATITADPVEAVRDAYDAFTSEQQPHGHPDTRPSASPPPCARPPTGGAPVTAHTVPPGTSVMLNVTISDRALFADSDEPAVLSGDLPIPAPLARRMLTELPADATVWIRRLYTRPDTHQLVTMDSRRRTFTPAMRRLILARDLDTCRTPWCDAPARHADHVMPAADGGPTAIDNGQALSEDCNYIRVAPGWGGTVEPDGAISVTTPTGHRYRSPVPSQPALTTTGLRVDVQRRFEDELTICLARAG